MDLNSARCWDTSHLNVPDRTTGVQAARWDGFRMTGTQDRFMLPQFTIESQTSTTIAGPGT